MLKKDLEISVMLMARVSRSRLRLSYLAIHVSRAGAKRPANVLQVSLASSKTLNILKI